jgi:hypothetical protein
MSMGTGGFGWAGDDRDAGSQSYAGAAKKLYKIIL